jgi:hypothetical protein
MSQAINSIATSSYPSRKLGRSQAEERRIAELLRLCKLVEASEVTLSRVFTGEETSEEEAKLMPILDKVNCQQTLLIQRLDSVINDRIPDSREVALALARLAQKLAGRDPDGGVRYESDAEWLSMCCVEWILENVKLGTRR